MELFKASQQWANRPEDERFKSLSDLYAATRGYAEHATGATIPWKSLRVEASQGEVVLVGRKNQPANFTHWAFGQLCTKIGAPSGYLRNLPATLACQNLNHGLAARAKDDSLSDAKLLLHINGSMVLRAITSENYRRIWNHEVVSRLLDLEATGKWEPAKPDFRHIGEPTPSLYASDHDMFAFLRSTTTVEEFGSSDPLRRGVIVENSEVGASALKLTRFLYRRMCGNHIIWGASKVVEVSVRHVGSIREKWSQFALQAKAWMDEGANQEEAKIKWAKQSVIAATKEQVLDMIFGQRSLKLTRDEIEKGYDAVRESEDGSPKTTWGMLQGLTRHSQTLKHADSRNDLDKRAGKLMEVEF